MKLKDDVCKFCPLLNTCKSKSLCAPLTWVDGNLKRKEPLIRDLSKASGEFEYSNYNDALAELITDAEQKSGTAIKRIKEIFLIQDYRTRGIGAMIFFKIPQKEIAHLLNITRQQLWNLLNK
jgi:hypothetical protein